MTSAASVRRAAALAIAAGFALSLAACGDDEDPVRADPLPGLYRLRTVNGAALPWVSAGPGADGAGRRITITDSVHVSSFTLSAENHEYARLDSGSLSAPGYQTETYALRFSGTYARLRGDTIRFTATSGSYNREPIYQTGFFPDTSYAVLDAGRLKVVRSIFVLDGGQPAQGAMRDFAMSYAK